MKKPRIAISLMHLICENAFVEIVIDYEPYKVILACCNFAEIKEIVPVYVFN